MKLSYEYWNLCMIKDLVGFRIYFSSLQLSWWITPSILRAYIFSFVFTTIPSILIYFIKNFS
jgi:hypothetical protein